MSSQAKTLRGESTAAERRLCTLWRNRQMDGAKFRRQHPFGPYILDFHCHEFRLAVELDGDVHGATRQARHDTQRTQYLERHNIRVVRFNNEDVYRDIEIVTATIRDEIATRRIELTKPDPWLKRIRNPRSPAQTAHAKRDTCSPPSPPAAGPEPVEWGRGLG